MYIVSLHYVKPLSEIERFIEPHRAFLDRYYESEIFIASGPKIPRTGGIILVKGMDRTALDAILAEDPFFQNGVASYGITEFKVTKTAAKLGGLAE